MPTGSSRWHRVRCGCWIGQRGCPYKIWWFYVKEWPNYSTLSRPHPIYALLWSMSNRSLFTRLPHFVTDDERRRQADGPVVTCPCIIDWLHFDLLLFAQSHQLVGLLVFAIDTKTLIKLKQYIFFYQKLSHVLRDFLVFAVCRLISPSFGGIYRDRVKVLTTSQVKCCRSITYLYFHYR